jgi:hypothetical protein
MKITKGNSRLLFDSQQLDSIDISKSISDIDLKIEGSTQLQLATDEIILVFSSNPNSQDFPSSQIKIGREVLGFDSNVFTVYKYQDFSKREVTCMKLNSFEKWNDVLSSLNIPVDTNSFRIVINDDFSALQVEY